MSGEGSWNLAFAEQKDRMPQPPQPRGRQLELGHEQQQHAAEQEDERQRRAEQDKPVAEVRNGGAGFGHVRRLAKKRQRSHGEVASYLRFASIQSAKMSSRCDQKTSI